MADGKTHSKAFFIGLPFFILLLIYVKLYWFLPILFLSNPMIDPDEDQKWLKGRTHRNFITHSLLWGILLSITFSTSLYGYVDKSFVVEAKASIRKSSIIGLSKPRTVACSA